jgi:hypothetical protein
VTAPSMSHPSLQVSSGHTLVQIKISLCSFVKKITKEIKYGSGYVFERTAKQGLKRKVALEQAKPLRESSGKTRIFLM